MPPNTTDSAASLRSGRAVVSPPSRKAARLMLLRAVSRSLARPVRWWRRWRRSIRDEEHNGDAWDHKALEARLQAWGRAVREREGL